MKTTSNPGVMTTEFWIAAITSIIGVLVMFGVISPSQAALVNSQTPTIIGAIMTGAPAVTYIIMRVILKRADITTPTALPLTSSTLSTSVLSDTVTNGPVT